MIPAKLLMFHFSTAFRIFKAEPQTETEESWTGASIAPVTRHLPARQHRRTLGGVSGGSAIQSIHDRPPDPDRLASVDINRLQTGLIQASQGGEQMPRYLA